MSDSRDIPATKRFAWILGLAGLLPFVAQALFSWLSPPVELAGVLRSQVHYAAAILTFLGGLVRGFSTMPFVAEAIDKNVQFWLGFVGQTLTGMGNPMAVAVPTKVKLILAF